MIGDQRQGPPVINVAPLISAFGREALPDRHVSYYTDGVENKALAQTLEEVRKACSEWGFFQCVNHGIDNDTIRNFDAECRNFFDLPLSIKQPIKRTAENSRGWFDDELTKQRRDWKECIDIGQPGWSKVDGENQWPDPDSAPNFRKSIEDYYAACLNLSRVLLRAASVGLGMRPDHFDSEAEPHTSYLRLNYYPVCDQKVAPEEHGFDEPDPEIDGNLGINKHTDAGCLTILRQYASEPASLQVYHLEDKKWYRCVPVEGALTINIGDMMQVWSNGKYRAPVHRVLANPTQIRYSAPFFYNPSYESMIAPVSSCGSPTYYPLSWAEFRRRRFEGDFGDYAADVQISDWLIDGGKYGGGRSASKL